MPLLEIAQTRKISTPLAGQVAPSHRIRKAAVADAAESPERKTHGGVELVEPCEGEERDPHRSPLGKSQRCFAPEES